MFRWSRVAACVFAISCVAVSAAAAEQRSEDGLNVYTVDTSAEQLAAFGDAAPVHGDDVRMTRQGAHRLAFALEPAPDLGVADAVREDLHGDPSPERGFVGDVHNAEAAPPDRLESLQTRDDR